MTRGKAGRDCEQQRKRRERGEKQRPKAYLGIPKNKRARKQRVSRDTISKAPQFSRVKQEEKAMRKINVSG